MTEDAPTRFPIDLLPDLVRELADRTVGGRIRKVKSPAPHVLWLGITAGKAKEGLLVSMHRRFPRIHLTDGSIRSMASPSRAATTLRGHLLNRRIEHIEGGKNDRIVSLHLDSRKGETHRSVLVVEFIPRRPNLFFLKDGQVSFAFYNAGDRALEGGAYAPPPPIDRRGRSDEAGQTCDGPSRWVDIHLGAAEEAFEKARLSARLGKTIKRRIAKSERHLKRLREDLVRTETMDIHRRHGELLKSVFPTLSQGQREVTVTDFFDPNAPSITLPLNPALSPQQNMQACFDRAKKLSRGRIRIGEIISRTETALSVWKKEIEKIQSATSISWLRELAEERGLLKEERSPSTGPISPGKTKVPDGVRPFTSADGLPIFVGRRAADNDRLTFHIARGSDWWFHVSGVPGPHVLVRLGRDLDLPFETVLDAAALAVFFSRARGRVCEVIYAQRRHLARPRKGKKGLVSYSKHRRVRIGSEEQRLARLLKKKEDGTI